MNDIANTQHLLFGVQVTGRVVRIADEDSTRLVGNLFLKFLHRRQLESVLDMGLDGLDYRTARDSESHVVGVTRVGHNNLVTRIEAGHEREQNRLTTAGRDDNLVGTKVDAVLGIIAHHLRAQRLRTL